MASKSGGLLNKLIWLLSLLLLGWTIPLVVTYYENLDSYNQKTEELQELRIKHNIKKDIEAFTIEGFKKDTEEIFSEVQIEKSLELDNEYSVVVQIDKKKIKKFNSFIETLALRYFVKIKDNELNFEEKEQHIEIKFILESL